MIRLGLCCIFNEEPIRFRRTTAAYLKRQAPAARLDRLAEIAAANAAALKASLVYCRDNGIGAFRINSQILPVKTHPEVGYSLSDLPGSARIIDAFKSCGRFGRRHDIRTSFHPDQFIVLSSPQKDLVDRSTADLAYQAEVAEWVNADVINIHAGGAYGDKTGALIRLEAVIETLPASIRTRLTLENDDRSYTPRDLLPLCERMGIPFVYDVHHHRCLPDGLTESAVTRRAMGTWNREPLFHLSSPAEGWAGPKPNRHHDFIDPADLPAAWLDLDLDLTVDVEAKAKETAIARLRQHLRAQG
ncbi:MAG: UV DNA damage repair endonuclease UvsE [Desulfobacterales bacterium]|nr:UV DNA damage repair endonuclease UvsE [Desulfobacterales bacterium]